MNMKRILKCHQDNDLFDERQELGLAISSAPIGKKILYLVSIRVCETHKEDLADGLSLRMGYSSNCKAENVNKVFLQK